jgi:hypothetical protein
MMSRRILAFASMVLLVSAGLVTAGPVSAADAFPRLTVDTVLVNGTGGITVMGTVDCSAAVVEHWGSISNVPADTVVLINVSWTAYQPAGRKFMLKAELQDSQASPCWANYSEGAEPGRCIENLDTGILAPCRWDSSNWGSGGYMYGNGMFKKGAVHVDVMLEGGYYGGEDEDGNPLSIGIFRIYSFDLKATKSR